MPVNSHEACDDGVMTRIPASPSIKCLLSCDLHHHHQHNAIKALHQHPSTIRDLCSPLMDQLTRDRIVGAFCLLPCQGSCRLLCKLMVPLSLGPFPLCNLFSFIYAVFIYFIKNVSIKKYTICSGKIHQKCLKYLKSVCSV